MILGKYTYPRIFFKPFLFLYSVPHYAAIPYRNTTNLLLVYHIVSIHTSAVPYRNNTNLLLRYHIITAIPPAAFYEYMATTPALVEPFIITTTHPVKVEVQN